MIVEISPVQSPLDGQAHNTIPDLLVTPEALTPAQTIAVHVESSAAALKRSFELSKQYSQILRKEEGLPDEAEKDLVLQNTFGLIDLHRIHTTNPQDFQKGVDSLGEHGEFLHGVYRLHQEEFEADQQKIESEVRELGESPIEKANNYAYKVVSQLPRELRVELYSRAQLKPQPIFDHMKQWGYTVALDAVSFAAIDGFASLVGTAFMGINSYALPDMDTKAALSILGASYVLWSIGMLKNAKANFEMLKEDDVATKALSKLAYDQAKKHTDNEKVQQIASYIGFGLTELVKEIPYYTAGAIIHEASDSAHNDIFFLAGANVGAAAFEFGQAKITSLYSHNKEVFRQKRDDVTHRLHLDVGKRRRERTKHAI